MASTPAILSLREAAALKKPTPYTYTLFGTPQLFMFGAAHFRTATDPQFALMQLLWGEFKALDGAKIAIVEPGIGPISDTFEGAIKTAGEAGATLWLGLRDGVGILCADLDFRERLALLVKEFGADAVAYWVIAREMDIYYRNPGSRTADEALTAHLKSYRRRFEEIGVAGDRAWFDAKHAQVSGGKPIDDKEYWDFVNSWNGPKVFIDIIEMESRLRNERILSVITHLRSLGLHIFVTYGATHVVQLEPALRALVEG